MPKKGFTLIELLVVMGLFAVLAAISFISLGRPQIQAVISSSSFTLVSDLRAQQLKAMAGDTLGEATSQPHGIYFETNQYTLFKGASYNASDTTNLVIELTGVTLTNINFPSNQVVFEKSSGEVSGYVSGSDNVTVAHSDGSSSTITVNRYGVASVN